jgi:hypothetical protein
MSSTTMVPLTVSAEATEFIDEAGLRPSVERALEHVRQTARGLSGLRVNVEYDETVECPLVVIEAVFRSPPTDDLETEWHRWRVEHLPREHYFNLRMEPVPG